MVAGLLNWEEGLGNFISEMEGSAPTTWPQIFLHTNAFLSVFNRIRAEEATVSVQFLFMSAITMMDFKIKHFSNIKKIIVKDSYLLISHSIE